MSKALTMEKEIERKNKISLSVQKRWQDEDYRQKVGRAISKAKMGHSVSKETINKIKESWTPEMRQESALLMIKFCHTSEAIKKATETKRERGHLFLCGEGNLAKKPEIREAISEALKGKSGEHNKTDAKREASSVGLKKAYTEGRREPVRLVGEQNPRWKGGSLGHYNGVWRQNRKIVLIRDASQCQSCLESGDDVHHIIPFRISKNHAISNLITLCHSCHQKVEAFTDRFLASASPSEIIREANVKNTLEDMIRTTWRHVEVDRNAQPVMNSSS